MRHGALIAMLLAVLGVSAASDVRLDSLRRQAALSLEQLNYNQLRQTSARLLRLSREAGDQRYEAWACLYLGNAELMNGDKDRSMRCLKRADHLARLTANDTIRSLALNAIAIYEASTNMNMYLAQRYFLTSLEYADRCHYDRHKGTVYANLSIIARSQRDSTGVKYAMNCYEFGLENNRPHLVYQGAYNVAAFRHDSGDNAEALRYLDISLGVQREHHYSPDPSIFVLYSAIYADMGQLGQAEHHAREALRIALSDARNMLPGVYCQLAYVEYLQQRYQPSIDHLQQALAATGRCKDYTSVVDIYDLLAKDYEAMGNDMMALRYLKQAKDSSTALSLTDRQHLIQERQMVFDMMKREQEATLREQQLSSQRKINATLMGLLLLFAVLLFVVVRNSHRRNQLYKNIVQQNTDAIKREQELRQSIRRLQGELQAGGGDAGPGQDEPEPPDGPEAAEAAADADAAGEPAAEVTRKSPLDTRKSQQLYDQLCRLMEEGRVYRDTQLGRESLADQLGTNRTYLSQVISDHTEMNFSQFVNYYRIREAVRILSDKQQMDYPLKQLCTDLGFLSLSNFYKTFQKQVGMSPSAYRKSVQDV